MSLSVKVGRVQVRGRRGNGTGDPGIFGAIGSVVSKVASVAKIIPGPIGMAASAVSRLTSPKSGPLPSYFQPTGATRQPVASSLPGLGFPQQPTPGLTGMVQRLLPGGSTGMQDVSTVGAPAGYHVNKTGYFLKDGTYIPEQSRWVRNRHRNPLNPRAASKAIGRIESLKRATKRFSRITIRSRSAT